MRCSDCGGGVPGPLWRRCVACAMKRLRAMMSDVPLDSLPPPARRWKIHDRVLVVPADGSLPFGGKVARAPRGDEFVIDVDAGGRYFADVSELREP